MKRVSVALAALTAVLLVGTASAQVPDGSGSAMSRLRQLGLRPLALEAAQHDGTPAGPVVAGTRGVRDAVGTGEGVVDAESLIDPETLEPVTGALEGTPLIQDLIAGLPPQVADILNALPFAGPDPVEAPAPAPDLVPELGPAEPAPAPPSPPAKSVKPVPAPKPARAPGQLRVAGERQFVFPGLPGAGHAGYTTGTASHTDTLTVSGTQLQNLDIAFSGSTFTSAPLNKTLVNEMARPVAPQLAANSGFGKGLGLELGLGTAEGAQGQVVLANAEAKSPPSTDLVTVEELNPDAEPLVSASILRGRARSLANAACTTGVDLSFGEGYAVDAGIVGQGDDADLLNSNAPAPHRGVSQSTSRTRLVPQAGTPAGPIAKFGLMSETRQTLAPVTLLEGTEDQFTIEFLGEWVLRAIADGKDVGEVFYGPGEVEPQTPVLRIIDENGEVINNAIITTQQLLGDTGLELVVPTVARVVIGEDPRAIGSEATTSATETPTYAAGAIDVARIQFLNGGLADVRVGHMEAAVAVPEGGIECGIGLVKESSHEVVRPGQSFTWTLTVENPNDCVLREVKLVDTVSTPGTTGIKYAIEGTTPKADSQTGTTELIWNDIGPIDPGGSKKLTIDVGIAPDSGGGRFLNEGVATGVCGPAEADAEGAVGVPLEARVALNLPEVLAEAPLAGELPRTGGLLAALPALALIGGGLALRRMKGR